MTGSILSWDDAAEDENPLLTKARASIATIDTKDVEAEMEAEAKAREALKHATAANLVQPVPANDLIKPQHPIDTKGMLLQPLSIDYGQAHTAMERAKLAVAEYNKQFTFGERVLAENKRLINAKTDLNQLIPFKYSWAWSMYLESTNAHWMPTEMEGYLRDITMYPDLPEEAKKLISGFVVNYMYSQYIYPATMIVTLYKTSTNPEVRQYQLRQAFEEQVFHHSMRHMIEIFDLDKPDILKHKPIEDVLRLRNKQIYPYLAKLADLDTSTESLKDIGDYIVSLATMYGGLRGLYHLVPMMRIWQYSNQTGHLMGVADNVVRILRDLNRQWDFGVRYIVGIIDENPGALTETVVERIIDSLTCLHRANIVLAEGNEEIIHCSELFMNMFLRDLNLTPPNPMTSKPHLEGYVNLFNSLNKTDHNNAATSVTGNGGGLEW